MYDLAPMPFLPYAGRKSAAEEAQEADVHELHESGRHRFRAAPDRSGCQQATDQQYNEQPIHFSIALCFAKGAPTNRVSNEPQSAFL